MDDVARYADDVAGGRIIAGPVVRAACARHLADLAAGPGRGLVWDGEAADHGVRWFSFLQHSKGEWAGTPVRLEPWQVFHVGSLFGWKREDGRRRFRTSYLEVARKNGKSTIAAGVGLYLFFADGEPGAEVYTAATKRDQARITHAEATRMVKASPFLRQQVGIFKDNLHVVGTASKFEPLGRDADSMDGLNVHGAIVDEVHAHRSRDVWDVLDTATGARRQSLMYAITTAGYDRQSICWELHDYAAKVAEGVVEDDTFWGAIYGLDEEDEWEDEAVWLKANPNLGVSKSWEDMRRKAARAKEMPAALNAFLRLELNVWTQAATRWISPSRWAACNREPVDEAALAGLPAWGGLDLSSTLDVTALVWVFMNGSVLPRFFIPEENVAERVRRDRVPFDVWIRQGLVMATPGDVVDYDFVQAVIERDLATFDVQELAFDPWNATALTNKLAEDGAPLVQFRQGYISMNPAMKALEVAIQRRALNHGGNPVLRWMADNVVAAMDPAGNLKPDKSKSTERIDGIVALLMAWQRMTVGGGQRGSVYEERGLLSL